MNAEDLSFEADVAERGASEPALVVDVEGFEGPLDLLLTLARQQKVDLAKIGTPATDGERVAYAEALLAQNKFAEAHSQISQLITSAPLPEQSVPAFPDPQPGRAFP